MKSSREKPFGNVVVIDDSSENIAVNLSPHLKQAGYNIHPVVRGEHLPTILRLNPCAVVFNAEYQNLSKSHLVTTLRKELKSARMIGILGENDYGRNPDLEYFDRCFVRPVDEKRLLAAISPRGPRVLVIDDYAPLAEATAELVRHEGLEVEIASTGEEGLKTAAVFQPEIILCDLRLPDIPGLEVARALRAMQGVKHAVIAMYTAMSEAEVRVLERNADPSVNAFLAKPLTEEKLAALKAKLKTLQRSVPRPASHTTDMWQSGKARGTGNGHSPHSRQKETKP